MGGRSSSFRNRAGGGALYKDFPENGYFTDKGLTQAEYDKNKDLYGERLSELSKADRKRQAIVDEIEDNQDRREVLQGKHDYDVSNMKPIRIPGNHKYGVEDSFVVPGKNGTYREIAKGYPENVYPGMKVGAYHALVHTYTREFIPPDEWHPRGFYRWHKDTKGDDLTPSEKRMVKKYGNNLNKVFRYK